MNRKRINNIKRFSYNCSNNKINMIQILNKKKYAPI